MIPDSTSSKVVWRAWAKKLRPSLPDVSAEVCKHLEGFLLNMNPRVVLSYKAFAAEISLEHLASSLPATKFWTTRVNTNSRLSLHSVSSATIRHRLGMLEPDPSEPELEPGLVDAVLVPGLVFDRFGTRLGYGAGFYDRLLSKFHQDVILIGVTRDALLLENPLPKDDFDLPMTHLVTESGLRKAVSE